MKNKNRIYRAAALLLVLCFISTVMISGTFAKYTSTYSGQDTALVAKWSFNALGQTPSTETTELNLFQHEFDKHINRMDEDNYIIAPGVNGEFVVAMDYLADVDADVVISINPLSGNANVPIEYLVDGGSSWVTLGGLAEALAERIASSNTYESAITDVDENTFRIASVAAGSNAVEISETVQWRWAYYKDDDVDKNDTSLGLASAGEEGGRTSYGIEITLTATQVDPNDQFIEIDGEDD